MSKKKGKTAAKKPLKKKTAKKAARRPASRALMSASAAAPESTPRVKTVTIFIFRNAAGATKIRTSPQRVYANPGDSVEFNTVNMIDDSDVPVTITFNGEGPWGKGFEFRNWERKGLLDAPLGRFKYTVSAMGAEEDPEVELPDGPP
jgi:hypothetical protein